MYLKAIQRWLLDVLLARLPVHEACHSYRAGKSIVSNSERHIGKAFVACMDIENFFGSIVKRDVVRHLISAGLWPQLSDNIASLSTFRGRLPQGAPTSPMLSNSYLFQFDEAMTHFGKVRDVEYTRYADDLTFSGNSRESVKECVVSATERLLGLGLRVNGAKTRIVSRQGQQRVTGVVVNELGVPSRKFRREVRARFHNAGKIGEIDSREMNRLRGLVSYLRQFPGLRESRAVSEFQSILGELRLVPIKEDHESADGRD